MTTDPSAPQPAPDVAERTTADMGTRQTHTSSSVPEDAVEHASAWPSEQLSEAIDSYPAAIEPVEPRDPVAVIALVAAILLLAVPAGLLAWWGVRRAHAEGRRGRLARGVLVAAIVELVLGAVLWAVYFAVLAPLVALPTV